MKQILPQTWVEISKKNLLANVRNFTHVLPKDTECMAVIKANAYGHGLSEVLDILKGDNKVNQFAVFDTTDALFVRSKTPKPVLVLCSTDADFWATAGSKKIDITISTLEQLRALTRWQGKELRVHLKVDTGLGRQGLLPEMMDEAVALITKMKKVTIVGLYTHFSGTESHVFDQHTEMQYKTLLAWKEALYLIGVTPLVHAGATSGALHSGGYALDIARFGIGLYGLWPSDEVRTYKSGLVLNPVLSLRTHIVEVKKLSKGAPIAYDCTHKLKRDSVVAVLPVGYYDGLPRALSDKGTVLIHGKSAPILGRVMMNMCVVDVTDIPNVRMQDIVTIIGTDKGVTQTAEMVAEKAGTINYEIVTRLSPLLPRIIK